MFMLNLCSKQQHYSTCLRYKRHDVHLQKKACCGITLIIETTNGKDYTPPLPIHRLSVYNFVFLRLENVIISLQLLMECRYLILQCRKSNPEIALHSYLL